MSPLVGQLIGCYIGLSLLIGFCCALVLDNASADPRNELHQQAVRTIAACHGPVGVFLVAAVMWPLPCRLPGKTTPGRHHRAKRRLR